MSSNLKDLRLKYEENERELASRVSNAYNAGQLSMKEALAGQRDLLRQIAVRKIEVEAGARWRDDIAAAIDQHTGGVDLTLQVWRSIAKQIAVYHERWAQPGETPSDSLEGQPEIPEQYREWAAIYNDIDLAVGEVDRRGHQLYLDHINRLTGKELDQATSQDDIDATLEELFADNDRYGYYDVQLLEGGLPLIGDRQFNQASSADSFHVSRSGSNWEYEVSYYLTSAGDDTWGEEVSQRKVWLKARELRQKEAAGIRVLPPGIDKIHTVEPPEFSSSPDLDLNDPYIIAADVLCMPYHNQYLRDVIEMVESQSLELANPPELQYRQTPTSGGLTMDF